MKDNIIDRHDRKPRWYFGGISGTTAAAITHPFDVVKVSLQTSLAYNPTIVQVVKRIIRKNNGRILSLYSGVSAAIFRQLTYTTTRFGIYELGKPYIKTDQFVGKLTLATIAGVIGGLIGTPADVVNVRMQSDLKLSKRKRRNYKHVFDGLNRVYRGRGIRGLFTGVVANSLRGIFTTIVQIVFYEQIKSSLMKKEAFQDNLQTHVLTSLMCSALSTIIVIPFDVVKTQIMNSRRSEDKSLRGVIMNTAKMGPRAFYKGYIPTLMRNAPYTVILFICFEQLRLNFGIDPITEQTKDKGG